MSQEEHKQELTESGTTRWDCKSPFMHGPRDQGVIIQNQDWHVKKQQENKKEESRKEIPATSQRHQSSLVSLLPLGLSLYRTTIWVTSSWMKPSWATLNSWFSPTLPDHTSSSTQRNHWVTGQRMVSRYKKSLSNRKKNKNYDCMIEAFQLWNNHAQHKREKGLSIMNMPSPGVEHEEKGLKQRI